MPCLVRFVVQNHPVRRAVDLRQRQIGQKDADFSTVSDQNAVWRDSMKLKLVSAAVPIAVVASLAFSAPSMAQSTDNRMMGQGVMQPGVTGQGMMQPGMMGQGRMGHGVMQPGMMGHGMMHHGMSGQGMMGHGMSGQGMMQTGMIGPMMLVMMDTDGDKAISFEEMEAVHKRMFDLVDADGDGKVTIGEIRQFHTGTSQAE